MKYSFAELESPYLQETVLGRESPPGWGSGARLAWEDEAQSSLDAGSSTDALSPSMEDEGLDQESLGQELWSPADKSEESSRWGAHQEEKTHAGRDTEIFDDEAWSGSAEQLAFRDSVLAAQLVRSRQRRKPFQDLSSFEIALVPGTPGIEMAREAGAAAGRLLRAANTALADARRSGDADALRTVRLSATSGYRSANVQRNIWQSSFPRFYKESRSTREKLVGGPHSSEAVNFMLKPHASGGFGLPERIAAPGYSEHQKGIAIDLIQERIKGHEVPNRTDKQSRKKWADSWIHKWLSENAIRFGFQPYRFEPWHWIYRGTVSPWAGRSQPLQVSIPGSSSTVASFPGAKLIRFAQVVLNASEGEQLNLDGILGSSSQKALDRFRRRYALGAGAMLDAPTVLALVQRALEELASASMTTQYGRPDALTNLELIRFKSLRGLGFDAKLDAATLMALGSALAAGKGPASRRPVGGAAPQLFLGGLLWTFNAQIRDTPVAVFCPPTALGQRQVDLLLFAHGLMSRMPGKLGCPRPDRIPVGLISGAPFHLGKIVAEANRPMVLVVPLLDWSNPGGSAAFGSDHPSWHALAKPAHLNALIGEVLSELGRVQSLAPPTVSKFFIAGHSRAHSFMEALAHMHTVEGMKEGALARLVEVWSLDATYEGNPAKWRAWLDTNPQLRAHVIYRSGNTRTAKVGEAFYSARSNRLLVSKTREQHCTIPNKFLPGLLAGRDTAFDKETEYPTAQVASGQDEMIFEPEDDTSAGESSPDLKEQRDFDDELDEISQSQDTWESPSGLEVEDVVSLSDSQVQDLDLSIPADVGRLEPFDQYGLDKKFALAEENFQTENPVPFAPPFLQLEACHAQTAPCPEKSVLKSIRSK